MKEELSSALAILNTEARMRCRYFQGMFLRGYDENSGLVTCEIKFHIFVEVYSAWQLDAHNLIRYYSTIRYHQ